MRKYLLREVFLFKLKKLRKNIVYIQEKFKNCRKNKEARVFIMRMNFIKEFKFLLRFYRYKALFSYNTKLAQKLGKNIQNKSKDNESQKLVDKFNYGMTDEFLSTDQYGIIFRKFQLFSKDFY